MEPFSRPGIPCFPISLSSPEARLLNRTFYSTQYLLVIFMGCVWGAIAHNWAVFLIKSADGKHAVYHQRGADGARVTLFLALATQLLCTSTKTILQWQSQHLMLMLFYIFCQCVLLWTLLRGQLLGFSDTVDRT